MNSDRCYPPTHLSEAGVLLWLPARWPAAGCPHCSIHLWWTLGASTVRCCGEPAVPFPTWPEDTVLHMPPCQALPQTCQAVAVCPAPPRAPCVAPRSSSEQLWRLSTAVQEGTEDREVVTCHRHPALKRRMLVPISTPKAGDLPSSSRQRRDRVPTCTLTSRRHGGHAERGEGSMAGVSCYPPSHCHPAWRVPMTPGAQLGLEG